MSYGAFLRIWETRVVADKSAGMTGADTAKFAVDSGARAIFTISVTQIDPGATIAIGIDNLFGESDPAITLDTVSLTAVGQYQRVYADFNSLFNLRLNVTGGGAQFKIVCTLNDNAGTSVNLQFVIHTYRQ